MGHARCGETGEATDEVRLLHDVGCRRRRVFQLRREPGLSFGVGRRQPDDVFRCLCGLCPGGAAHAHVADRAGHGDLRHSHPAGARGGDRDLEPDGAGAGVPGHRHRQYGAAHDGAEADENGRVRRVSTGADGADERRGGGLHVRGSDPPDQDAAARHAVHEFATADTAVRLRLRAAGDGPGGRVWRRADLRHSAARRAGARRLGPRTAGGGPFQPRNDRVPQCRAVQRGGAGAGRARGFRSDQAGYRSECDGERLLLLRSGAGA